MYDKKNHLIPCLFATSMTSCCHKKEKKAASIAPCRKLQQNEKLHSSYVGAKSNHRVVPRLTSPVTVTGALRADRPLGMRVQFIYFNIGITFPCQQFSPISYQYSLSLSLFLDAASHSPGVRDAFEPFSQLAAAVSNSTENSFALHRRPRRSQLLR